jgi:hypothetical protein
MSHLKSEFLLDLGKFHGLQTEQCGESRKNCDTNKLSNVEENILNYEIGDVSHVIDFSAADRPRARLGR